MLLSILIAIVIGGVAGWLASKVLNRDAEQGFWLNVLVGVIGSLVGNFALSALLPGEVSRSVTEFSLPALGVSFLGALILLAIVNLFTRGRVK